MDFRSHYVKTVSMSALISCEIINNPPSINNMVRGGPIIIFSIVVLSLNNSSLIFLSFGSMISRNSAD